MHAREDERQFRDNTHDRISSLKGAALRHNGTTARFSVQRLIAVVGAVALGASLVMALPAAADPSTDTDTQVSQPTTADEAKAAWLDAADKAEIANQEVLEAQERQKAAESSADDAMVELVHLTLLADSADASAVSAAAEYADLKEQLSHFAAASYRGVRFSQLSALLTAQSSTDYLDEVASLDQVAGHTKELMKQALDAKTAAEGSADIADEARSNAAAAEEKADAALRAAQDATRDVEDRKEALENDVKQYRQMFSTLSATERQAAIDAQQAAWEEQARELAELAAGDGALPGDASSTDSDSAAPKKAQAVELEEAPNARAQIAVDSALGKVGSRYIYGASGPNAFDCSGLTSWAWAKAGVSIPRTSGGQAQLKSVALDQLQPGDLVTYYSPVHHVAMYIGNGQIVHASTEGKPVFITSVYRGGPYPTGHRPSY